MAVIRTLGNLDPIRLSNSTVQQRNFTQVFPVEIIVRIFLLLRNSLGCIPYGRELDDWLQSQSDLSVSTGWKWTTVTHVCQVWRAVAIQCPQLWTQIHSGTHTHPDQTRTYLDRSQSSYLTVRHVRNVKSHISRKVSMDCLQLVLNHLHRIQDLRIRIFSRHFIENIHKLLSQPAPCLRNFIISWRRNYGDPEAYLTCLRSLLCGSAPQLRFLNLDLQIFHWDSALFQNLQSLILRQIESPFDISDILKILRACPNLENFGVYDCFIENNHIENLESVDLPMLKGIYLAVIDSTVYEELIKRLSFPTETEWGFDLDYASLQEHAQLPIPTIVNSRPCKILYLYFLSYSLRLKSCCQNLQEDSADLTLRWENPYSALQVFAFTSRIIEGGFWHHATSLQVSLENVKELTGNATEKESCWRMVLKLLPNLQNFYIDFQDKPGGLVVDQTALIRALGCHDESDEYLCPQLLEMVLTSPIFHDVKGEFLGELQNCLKSRSQAGFGIKTLAITDAYGITSDMVDKLRGLGVVEVDWDSEWGVRREYSVYDTDTEAENGNS